MVESRRRTHSFVLVALTWALVFLSLGAAAQDLLPHTDDGCEVEQHCVLCRTAAVRAGSTPPSAAPVAAGLAVEGWCTAQASLPHSDACISPAEPRGPPRSL